MFRRLVITFPAFGIAVLTLPIAAFIICVGISVAHNFEAATYTHCRVYNFLPSISAAVGGFEPQIHIWKYAILLHTLPRIFIAILYLRRNLRLLRHTSYSSAQHHTHRRASAAKYDSDSCNPFDCEANEDDRNGYGAYRSRNPHFQSSAAAECNECSFLPLATFVCNLVEIVSLCRLSLIPSREDFDSHKLAFCLFALFGFFYMLLTVVLHSQRPTFVSPTEAKSYRLKKWTFAAYVSSFVAAGYFYSRHNTFCEPNIYSYFALSEYCAVFANVAFHATVVIDFGRKKLVLVDLSNEEAESTRRLEDGVSRTFESRQSSSLKTVSLTSFGYDSQFQFANNGFKNFNPLFVDCEQ